MVFNITVDLNPISISSTIWAIYVDNLWSPPPNGWVIKTAYMFRVLAFLLLFPILILTLLDLASYGIARTLGVVDESKASTTSNQNIIPTINIQSPTSPSFGSSSISDSPAPDNYFGSESESNLQLSGVGVFSPASSRPPSPTITRKNLPTMTALDTTHVGDGDGGQVFMRRRRADDTR